MRRSQVPRRSSRSHRFARKLKVASALFGDTDIGEGLNPTD